MRKLQHHERIGLACAGIGLLSAIAGWSRGSEMWLTAGEGLFFVGFATLAIDRLIYRHLVTLLEAIRDLVVAIRALQVGRDEHGFVRMFRCRRDPGFGKEALHLVTVLRTSGRHEVCLSGVARLLLLPAGPWPDVAAQFLEAILKPRPASQSIRIKVILIYPFSVSARNRAIAEATWNRPCVRRTPFSIDCPPRPPAFEDDLGYYRESGLYQDCRAALNFWHHLADRLAGSNVVLSVRFGTQDPDCFVLRVDDVLLVEHYQKGRLSLDRKYVSGELPIYEYTAVSAEGASELGEPPFNMLRNHFEYLWKSESTLTMAQVIADHLGGVDFRLPIDLRRSKAAQAEIPLQRMDAIRENCFCVPSRRLFERVSGESVAKAGLRLSCAGRPIDSSLVDLGPGGLRLRIDGSLTVADLSEGIRISTACPAGRPRSEFVHIRQVAAQRCDAGDADYQAYRVCFQRPLPAWLCSALSATDEPANRRDHSPNERG